MRLEACVHLYRADIVVGRVKFKEAVPSYSSSSRDEKYEADGDRKGCSLESPSDEGIYAEATAAYLRLHTETPGLAPGFRAPAVPAGSAAQSAKRRRSSSAAGPSSSNSSSSSPAPPPLRLTSRQRAKAAMGQPLAPQRLGSAADDDEEGDVDMLDVAQAPVVPAAAAAAAVVAAPSDESAAGAGASASALAGKPASAPSARVVATGTADDAIDLDELESPSEIPARRPLAAGTADDAIDLDLMNTDALAEASVKAEAKAAVKDKDDEKGARMGPSRTLKVALTIGAPPCRQSRLLTAGATPSPAAASPGPYALVVAPQPQQALVVAPEPAAEESAVPNLYANASCTKFRTLIEDMKAVREKEPDMRVVIFTRFDAIQQRLVHLLEPDTPSIYAGPDAL